MPGDAPAKQILPRSFAPPQSNRENDVYECLKLHSFLPATHLAFICTLLGIETYALPRSHPSLCSATIRSWKARNLPGMHPPYSPVFPQRLVFCMVNRSGDFVRSRGETRDQSSADSRGSLSPLSVFLASATPIEQCRIHRENTNTNKPVRAFCFIHERKTVFSSRGLSFPFKRSRSPSRAMSPSGSNGRPAEPVFAGFLIRLLDLASVVAAEILQQLAAIGISCLVVPFLRTSSPTGYPGAYAAPGRVRFAGRPDAVCHDPSARTCPRANRSSSPESYAADT